MITYSIDQQRVIDERGHNLLVTAAAGSGKTSVLVERIIKKITDEKDRTDIDRILVVTFTHAAATEMKERIVEAIEEKLFKDPQNTVLQRQATLIHNASITTIDSFCLDVVRENYHKIDVDPSFRVASTGECDLLKKDALDNVFTKAYEEADPDFFNLIDCYVTKDKDSKVEDSVLNLYSFAMSYPWPEKWLLKNSDDYFYDGVEGFKNSDLLKRVYERTVWEAEKLRVYVEKARKICNSPDGPITFTDVVNEMDEFITLVKTTVARGDYDSIRDLLEGCKISLFPKGKKVEIYDPDMRKQVSTLRSAFTKGIKEICGMFYSENIEVQYERMKSAGRVVKALTSLTLKFKEEFERLKRERGIIDFTDMEHMAVKILIEDYEDMDHYTVTDVARDYRERFDEVMIDEYQDSNLVQEIILAAVSHQGTDMSPNRFMVGDVKQSIYRFRLARPQIFMQKEHEYGMTPASSTVIGLNENYRSRREVVDSVNKVFSHIMNPMMGGIEYGEKERLNFGASYYPESEDENTTCLYLIDTEGRRKSYVRVSESEFLAVTINKIVRSGRKIFDKKTKQMRPVSYGDIAVLLRSPKNWIDNVSRALNDHNVPFYASSVGTFYRAPEVQGIINFLRVLDNPLNDVPLFGSFTSFFGKADNELAAAISAEAAGGEYYYFEKMQGYHQRHPENKVVEDFINLIGQYRELSTYMPISDLITRLVTKTGYLLCESSKPMGKQREANIELLIRKASDFSKTSFFGIFHFLRYIELIEKTEQDEGEANIADEGADVVRVMSIHKSKGLEFPICIVMALEDDIAKMDGRGEFLTDIEEGIGANAIDPKARTKVTTIKRELIKKKIKDEALGESIRVLYVAMTRARDRLILLGAADNALESLSETGKTSSYLELLKEPVTADDNKYFDVGVFASDEIEKAETEISFDKKEAKAFLIKPSANGQLRDRIKNVLTFEYPHKELEGLYTKTSVSSLKMEAMEEVQGETEALFKEREREEYIPMFAGGVRHISGTDRGSAYHALLALIDYTKEPSKEEFDRQIKAAVANGVTTEAEVSLVNMNKILAFASTDMAKRMHAAALRGELYKEQPFVMGVSASRVNPAFPESETVLVQGVIDVFFYEGDKVVVLDYKTDNVKDAAELVERYRAQLDYYGDALKNLTGREVGERVLYSFGLNENIVIE